MCSKLRLLFPKASWWVFGGQEEAGAGSRFCGAEIQPGIWWLLPEELLGFWPGWLFSFFIFIFSLKIPKDGVSSPCLLVALFPAQRGRNDVRIHLFLLLFCFLAELCKTCAALGRCQRREQRSWALAPARPRSVAGAPMGAEGLRSLAHRQRCSRGKQGEITIGAEGLA